MIVAIDANAAFRPHALSVCALLSLGAFTLCLSA
jgi:hypothetical protein